MDFFQGFQQNRIAFSRQLKVELYFRNMKRSIELTVHSTESESEMNRHINLQSTENQCEMDGHI